MIFLSVIIPAFNEEKRLPLTLIDIDLYLRSKEFGYEILVINNGSTDKTKEIIRKFEPLVKNLSLIDMGVSNVGKGKAIRYGMLAAKGRWRLFMDADNSTALNEFDKILPELEENQVFIGSRRIPGSITKQDMEWQRRIAEKFLNYWAKCLFLLNGVEDEYCGFKCFSEKATTNIFPLCVTNDWAFDLEVLSLAQRLGYKIKEIPVFWSHESGLSKFSIVDYLWILCQTFKIHTNLKKCPKNII